MEAFGTRMRGGLATMLSVALIVSGALLAAPAANAEEVNPQGETAVVDAPAVEAPADATVEAPAPAPADDIPAQAPADVAVGESPAEEAPVGDEAEAPEGNAASPSIAAALTTNATPTIVVTEAPRAGGEITVAGAGFNPAYPGVYVGFGPAGLSGFYTGAASLTDIVHVGPTNVDGSSSSGRTAKLNADGTFTTKFTVPAFAESNSYALYVSKAHGQGMSDTSQNVVAGVTYAAPVVATPSVEVVGSVSDLDPEASNTVTVRGTGFVPSAPATSGGRQPLAGQFTGTYVAFGSYANVWQPSTGAATATRVGLDVKWALPVESHAIVGGVKAGAIELTAEGTFETTLTLTPDESEAVADGSWGIVTYPGGGAKYAPFETFTAVTFATPLPGSVQTTTSVTDQGLKVDVTATDLPGAIYAALIERGTSADLDMSKPDSYAAFALPFPKVNNGEASFSLVAPIDKLDRKKQYEVLVWKIHSLPDTDTTYGMANVEITKAQWDKLEGIKPPVEEPGVKPKPTTPGAGSLTWGISTPFADYVTGNISKGTVATSGVGGGRGGYVFPQATGSSWNADTRTGSVYYSGSVTFIGHGGLLRETFANPVITVNSPISGTISASGQSFPLNLAGAGFTANADGSATWSNVPVSGVISGGDGTGAGGALSVDNLSFTVGSASGLNFGSTTTTSKYAATRTAAATPPSATGLTVATPAAKLVAGGEIEITAGGFEPNEQGILVVIYSEPTVLDTNAKADKNGVVRWIGKLPKELTGKHTITLQGSVSVGQEITIAAADSIKKATKAGAAHAASSEVQSASALPNTGTIAWVWWTGALALIVAAGATTGLLVTQRRKNAAASRL